MSVNRMAPIGPAQPAVSVLLVDGDTDYATFLQKAFAPHVAIAFEHVTSGQAARALLAGRAVDVVLLNLGANGDASLADLRRDSELPPIVALTDRWDESAVARALDAGAEDILVKSESDPGMVARTMRYAIERGRFRAHLKQTGRRFRSLIENALDMISVIGADRTILYQSPSVERILGWQPADLVGRAFADFVHPDDASAIDAAFEHVFKGAEASRSVEFRMRGAAGWSILEATLQRLDSDPRREAVIHARDVTERRRSEATLRARETELRQAQKMEAVGRLAGGIAHDFNNLLTIIIGASEHLAERLGQDDELRREAETVRATAERAGALTKQLLAFGRRQVTTPTALDLNKLVARAESLLHRLMGETISVVVSPAPDLGAVRADPNQIEQVIFNLAVNARDAMPEGGRLKIETYNTDIQDGAREGVSLPAGPYVTVSVTDSGAGMDAATQARAFDPFFTTKEVGKGTGLGLSTVYGIVSQNGGAVTLTSEPKCGTRVTFYLPRVEAAVPAASGSRPMPQPKGGTETVLLVEDEDGVRELIRDILAGAGYRVLDASRPTTAIQMADQFEHPIHLMLTDIVMPDMNGRELASQLRLKRPTMKILYMSGYPEHAAQPGGVLESTMEFIPKPFERRALLWRIRGLLDGTSQPAQ